MTVIILFNRITSQTVGMKNVVAVFLSVNEMTQWLAHNPTPGNVWYEEWPVRRTAV